MGDSRAQGVQPGDDVMTVSKAALCEAFVEAFRLRILDSYDGPFHGGALPERHARQAVLDGLDRLSRMSNEVMADRRVVVTEEMASVGLSVLFDRVGLFRTGVSEITPDDVRSVYVAMRELESTIDACAAQTE